MKLCQTFTLAALSANFNSVFGIESTDLVNENSIIWNADKTLCLKMYGEIFEQKDFSYLTDEKVRAKAERKWAKQATCGKVTVGFSSDCRSFLDDTTVTTTEEDFPVQYKFRVSDHGGYFCIIGEKDIGHPCESREADGATWKVTQLKLKTPTKGDKKWKRNTFSNDYHQEHGFALEPYGCTSCAPLTHYFKFEDQTNALIYGTFENGDDNPQYVTWKESENNLLNAKVASDVDHTKLLANRAEEPSCDEPIDDCAENYLYCDYDSFMERVSNPTDVINNDNFPSEKSFVTYEGVYFILTNPNEKTFIAAIKVPTDNCLIYPGSPNYTILAKDYGYAPYEQISKAGVYNCPSNLQNTSIEPIFGNDVIVDEFKNGDGDLIISDPENGRNQVRLQIVNDWLWSYATGVNWGSYIVQDDQHLNVFVLNDEGVPEYVTTLALASLNTSG